MLKHLSFSTIFYRRFKNVIKSFSEKNIAKIWFLRSYFCYLYFKLLSF